MASFFSSALRTLVRLLVLPLAVQEMVLGIGGVRALRELGRQPQVFHMNEGHAGFLGVERISELVRASRQADSLICHRFKTPLALYSEAWVGWVCDIAAYFAMDVNGWKPGDDGRDQEARFVRKYKTAMAMIREAQDYMLTPDHRLLGTESPPPATPVSLPNRQWLSLRRLSTT